MSENSSAFDEVRASGDTTTQHATAASSAPARLAPRPGPSRPRGFAALSHEQRRELGRKGGKTAHERGTANKFTSETGRRAGRLPHENGTAHKWTSEEARDAGRKGGHAVRKPRQNGALASLVPSGDSRAPSPPAD